MTQHLAYNPDQFPTLARFHKSDAYFRAIVGPAGSGKTYACMWEVMIRALAQAPAADKVRYSRALVVRNTYSMLRTATLPTFRASIGPMFKVTESPTPKARCIQRLNDGTLINLEIVFQSFDSEESVRNALGVEPTFVLIDEISEFAKPVVLDIIRRCGRFPSARHGSPTFYGVWAAMNGPPESHWLYDWVRGKADDLFASLKEHIPHQQYFEAFMQPSGLIAPDYDWPSVPIVPEDWTPNPLAENVSNLPGRYGDYYAMLTGRHDRIRAYVLGEFSPLVTGKRVFPEFHSSRHILPMASLKEVPYSWPLYGGFDFGRTPVCCLYTASPGGRLIQIEEVMLEDASTATLAQDYLLPLLKRKYQGRSLAGAWGDPSGGNDDPGTETNPFKVLWEAGVPIEDPGGANRLGPRLEAVHQALTRLDTEGMPMLQIRDNCVETINSLGTAYIYDAVRGMTSDKPTKSHVRWVSDLADATQYACMGYFSEWDTKKTHKRLPKLRKRWL